MGRNPNANERLGQWITDNPIAIVAAALILTLIEKNEGMEQSAQI